MPQKRKIVIIPLPSKDFDPTEAGVSWKILTNHGIDIVFSTPNGQPAAGDPRMITGKGLGIWSSLLKADANGLSAYFDMIRSKEFINPLLFSEIDSNGFDGIVLPGGHAQGMKEYLESKILQNLVCDFSTSGKTIGAICHGTVLAARSKRPDGKSILYGRKTTALLRSQELTAWALTSLWLKDYYRTYPETVQSEVTKSLAQATDFISGPIPIQRDSLTNLKSGFALVDNNYISARWPGDAHQFGIEVAKSLTGGRI